MLKKIRPYFALFCTLFLLFALPKKLTSSLRTFFLASAMPHFGEGATWTENGLQAKVIMRTPTTWGSTVWINAGKRDNIRLGKVVVAKNSPAVVGNTLVGVVEEVKKKRSKLRLITDRSLCPSVRAVRGSEQNRVLYHQLTFLQELLAERDDVKNAQELAHLLETFRDQLDLDAKDLFLAKGELQGSSAPLWRMHGEILKGIGFNYDFADEKGPARNLRTGAVNPHQFGNPLLKVGDVLVTTGMDGIFPEGLHVGLVTKIFPLNEGGTSYSIEAKPLVPNLNALSQLQILPPI